MLENCNADACNVLAFHLELQFCLSLNSTKWEGAQCCFHSTSNRYECREIPWPLRTEGKLSLSFSLRTHVSMGRAKHDPTISRTLCMRMDKHQW